MRLFGVVVIIALALLGTATVGSSRPQAFNGEVWVGLKGWGSVKLGEGVLEHRTLRCTRGSCPAVNYLTRGLRVVLTEKPYSGWKFTRWRGACKGKRPTCTINVARLRPTASGERHVHVSATFMPVAPGLTREHPIPLHAEASAGKGWRVRINSVVPSAQLLPPPATGAEYFAANVKIGYFGGGSATPENDLTWEATGSHRTAYNPGANPCPNLAPQPPLPTYNPVPSGQSVTGYVCWQIAANDSRSLELFFGSGSLNFPGTTWFALH